MASGFSSDGSQSSPTAKEAESASGPANEPGSGSSGSDDHRQLLEQVLEATLQLGSSDEPVREEELKALVALTRRRMHEPLSVDTLTELVQTVLRLRYRQFIGTTATWEKMTRQIAETISDDPTTMAKMETLWSKLCEAAK